MQRVLAGDREAELVLLQRMQCVRGMIGYQCRRLGVRLPASEQEDLCQSTLLAVWRKLDQYAGAGRLESWVFRFTYLATMARLRELRRVPRLVEDLADAPAPRGGEDAAAASALEQHAALYAGLDRLSAESRRIVLLKHVEERSFEQIGRELDLPTNTAKTKYYRALGRLRMLLAPKAADLDPGGAG